MKETITPVVLLPEQIHFLIYDRGFHDNLPSYLQRTKDILIFGCTTALRVSDLMALERKQLLPTELGYSLSLHTKKTNAQVAIPLPDYCVDIIKRYQRSRCKYLLPRLAQTNLNLQIKEIGKRAGWDWTLPKYRTRQGKLVEQKIKGQSWKFYHHLMAHTMRRSAITTLLMMGVDEAVVRKLSGHSPGSKEFYKYVFLAQRFMDKQIQTAYRRLSENPSMYRYQQRNT